MTGLDTQVQPELLTFRLSYTPAFFSTSAAMGTVELTGLLQGRPGRRTCC